MNTPARAVRFDQYGHRDALYLTDVPMPEPGPGEVVIEIRAASINPFDTMIRSGIVRNLFPVAFPSGQGSDIAGVVVAVGTAVDERAVGDEVPTSAPSPPTGSRTPSVSSTS